MEILDATQDAWRPCHSLTTPRRYFGSAIQLGCLYAFGGQNSEYKALCDVEVYDILRDTWFAGNYLLVFLKDLKVFKIGPSLITPRRNTTGASLGNR